ncbi:MAG: imidazoleglycerol-phosphate dehydratase HisB [ANME-2 cluster archaeon]|nr:imidazoleglycerol-phosphate dehydratase HisB [ANME-2 cluster archaeon]MDF1557019.1 imidazoleglycerol-phosphate dehydratase HisB [ANME-2 cluster archaeon]
MRSAKQKRKTKETAIEIKINLDGTGSADIDTGVAFFDHMLTSLARHGGLDLTIQARGDVHIDEHHTIEDVGIVLGRALEKALGDKKGIVRFGEATVPMDEALAEVALDLGGRSYLAFDARFMSPKVGDFSTQMTRHFFESVVNNAGINAHLKVIGENDHHKIEALFKAFAVALKRAAVVGGDGVPSTKGVL